MSNDGPLTAMPQPPIRMVAPSSMSATASSKLETILFIGTGSLPPAAPSQTVLAQAHRREELGELVLELVPRGIPVVKEIHPDVEEWDSEFAAPLPHQACTA